MALAELHHEAEILASNLPPLMVAADRVASTVAQGVHGRRRVGQGETFWQYRRYDPGDSIQQIDWRRSAKSDTVYIRETEWEAAQSVWLWSDASPSMNYSSSKNIQQKSERADLLTLALGSLLIRGGEHIAPLGHGIVPTMGRTALNLLAQGMINRANLASLPDFEPIPRHGRLVLMSDFLEPLEDINRIVGAFADRGVVGHILQILDPAERSLPFGGRTRFEGMENEGNALIGRVEGVREDYRRTLEEHQQGLRDITRIAGWSFGVHMTDHSPESALLALYTTLAQPKEFMGEF